MGGKRYFEGTLRKNGPGRRFLENLDNNRYYLNELAASRKVMPKGLKNKVVPGRTKNSNAPKIKPEYGFGQKLMLYGALAALPFAAGAVYAYDSAGLDETYLAPTDSIIYSAQHDNLLEIAAILGVTAENVKNERLKTMSIDGHVEDLSDFWLEKMPGSKSIAYDNPTKYKIGDELTLEVNSGTREVRDSLRINLTLRNDGSEKIEVTGVELKFSNQGAKNVERSKMGLGHISPGESKSYIWDANIPEIFPEDFYAIPILTYEAKFSKEISSSTNSVNHAPLDLKISQKRKNCPKSSDDGKKCKYEKELKIEKPKFGELKLLDFEKDESDFCKEIIKNTSNPCTMILEQDQKYKITGIFEYKIGVGRALKKS